MTATRWLALFALTLGIGAAMTAAIPQPGDGRIDVAALARAVAREDDHVTAFELGEWIKDRRPHLRVVDLRSGTDFDSLHIPTAERAAIDSMDRLKLSRDETIVLYSEGGAHSAQAWVFLRALGYEHVYFLRGGIYEWLEQVVSPGLPVDATSAEREWFEKAAALSRYFGGSPRVGVTRGEATVSITQIKRRGC